MRIPDRCGADPVSAHQPVREVEVDYPIIADVEFRAIEGFPGYCVGSDGSVWSCRKRGHSEGWSPWRRRKTPPIGPGYPGVSLSGMGKKHVFFVHWLVAAAFLPPKPSPKHEVRHWDGNRLNNRVGNLLWGTGKENSADTIRHGRSTRGSRSSSAKIDEGKALQIIALLCAGVKQRTIAQQFFVSEMLVSSIRTQRAWSWLLTAEQKAILATRGRPYAKRLRKKETASCDSG